MRNNNDDDEEEGQQVNLNALRYYFHLMSQLQEQEQDNSRDLVEVDKNQLLTDFHDTQFAQELMKETKSYPNKPNKTIFSMLYKRESLVNHQFSLYDKKHISSRFLPSDKSRKTLAIHANQVFCGQFSKDGSIFMSACQDKMLRLYDAENWSCLKRIRARDVGWAVLDTDYSPDQRWVIYTSWSNYVHMCNTTGENETHESLDMRPESNGRFCLFSVKFSPNSQEIMGGSCDRRIYVYDLVKKERILRVDGHNDDINTVAYADETGNIFYSGSDDHLIKVWDRRQLKQGVRSNVGTLVGHLEGITHIHSKGDGRYFISNGKDQCIKLWDVRKMDGNNVEPKRVSHWDYRGGFNRRNNTFNGTKRDSSDTSLMTYRGHSVLQTLIRSFFSPNETTGSKYIYAGSHDGFVYIFDVLSGEIVKKLGGHQATIRDLSWHPFKPQIVSTSFDGTVRVFDTENSNNHVPTYNDRRQFNFMDRDDDSENDNDDDDVDDDDESN